MLAPSVGSGVARNFGGVEQKRGPLIVSKPLFNKEGDSDYDRQQVDKGVKSALDLKMTKRYSSSYDTTIKNSLSRSLVSCNEPGSAA